jgi:hypothetical protein
VARALAALVLVVLASAGCEDIRRFEGSWAGPVSADPAHRAGFAADATLRAELAAVSRRALAGMLDVPGEGPLPFQPIQHASDDVLGELRLDGDPLRTFLGYLRPASGESYLAVVSLYAEDQVQVRIIRGPADTYGVFLLQRTGAVH